MIKPLLLSISLAITLIPSLALGFSFPEIPFCPEGGPPGWMNRMMGFDDRNYGPPPPMFRPQYLYPVNTPYGQQTPLRQQPPPFYPSANK